MAVGSYVSKCGLNVFESMRNKKGENFANTIGAVGNVDCEKCLDEYFSQPIIHIMPKPGMITLCGFNLYQIPKHGKVRNAPVENTAVSEYCRMCFARWKDIHAAKQEQAMQAIDNQQFWDRTFHISLRQIIRHHLRIGPSKGEDAVNIAADIADYAVKERTRHSPTMAPPAEEEPVIERLELRPESTDNGGSH